MKRIKPELLYASFDIRIKHKFSINYQSTHTDIKQKRRLVLNQMHLKFCIAVYTTFSSVFDNFDLSSKNTEWPRIKRGGIRGLWPAHA